MRVAISGIALCLLMSFMSQSIAKDRPLKAQSDISKDSTERARDNTEKRLQQISEDNCQCQKKACCLPIKKCCDRLSAGIDHLETTLNTCCDAQMECCTDIKNSLQTIENILATCCPGSGTSCGTFFISEIPAGGLTITQPGHYIVCKPLFFSGTSLEARNQLPLLKSFAQRGLVADPFGDASFGVTIASNGVFFDLNSQTYTLSGTNTGGLLVLSGITGTLISNGTITADNSPGQFGVAITSAAAAAPAAAAAAATVANVAFANIAAAAAASAAAAAAPAAAAASAAPAAAAAVAAAAATATAVSAAIDPVNIIDPVMDPVLNTLSGILLQGLRIENSLNGLSLQGNVTNVYVRDVSINRSTQMGITQPSRSGFHGNFNFENITIANSGLNGIYTTFNQDNWTFNNVQIRNSGLNGAIFEGTQNLTFKNSQISQSGAKGLVASIRQSQNVTLSGLEIFNSGDENLRVDNVQDLSVTDSKFINYTPTMLPVVKIQDVNNAYIVGNEIMSAAGLADGLFIRNSHGLLIQDNVVKVFSNATSTTPMPQPPAIGSSSTSSLTNFIQQQYCMPTPPTPPVVVCTGSHPIGINLQGGVTATLINRCVVSGTPSVGIAVQPDTLNGYDEGVMIEQCIVDGAQCAGILFASALNCGAFATKVVNGQADGILIDASSSQTAVRDNTLINNRGFGIRNLGLNSQIYHNFASGNGSNYSTGILVAFPGPEVGSLENISG